MRILICSYEFYPHIGGIETAGMTLALGLAERGYDITVVTTSPAADKRDAVFPFSIIRKPGTLELLRLFQATDFVWHNQVSLRLLWPLSLVHRPLVLVHHCSLAERTTDATPAPLGGLKRAACMLGRNAFVSDALRRAIDLPGPIIYNAYDEMNFHLWPDAVRDRDVVFLGHLVRPKGADVLIDALALLAAKGMRLRATIIGAGPQDEALKAQVSSHGLGDVVEFTGVLRDEALSRTLARHRMMAVPSRGFEALPISALEALACGCVLVGSDSGGVPEAIGPCGIVIARDSAPELAAALERLTTDTALHESCRARIPQQLALFSKKALIDNCEQLIRDATAPGAVRA